MASGASIPSEAGAAAGEWSSVRPKLDSSLLSCIDSTFGFTQMTPVQAMTIPLLISYKDVVVEACTGSGKTLAFAVPTLQLLLRANEKHVLKPTDIGCIVVSPVRELARQTAKVFGVFVEYLAEQSNAMTSTTTSSTTTTTMKKKKKQNQRASVPLPHLRILCMTGSGSKKSKKKQQAKKVRGEATPSTTTADDVAAFLQTGGNILVATPGRLLDFLQLLAKKSPQTSLMRYFEQFELLVLDEADRLLQLGFIDTLRQILDYLPKQRRTGLFSATQTSDLNDLIRLGLRDPMRIDVQLSAAAGDGDGGGVANKRQKTSTTVASSSSASTTTSATPASLENYYSIVNAADKLDQLIAFIRSEPRAKIIVYFLTCAEVDYIWKLCSSLDLLGARRGVFSLHGNVPADNRQRVYERFLASPCSKTPCNQSNDDDNDEDNDARGGVLLCTDVAARGLDFPDVDWIIQFDAPQDPNAFVHRVGRTARAGKAGRAIVFIMPSEEAYVEFLALRSVALQALPPLPLPPPSERLLASIRRVALADRDVFERAQRAFVSYLRGYKEHRLSYVFPYSKLDAGGIAMAFGLLFLPTLRELRQATTATTKKSKSSPLAPFLASFQPISERVDTMAIPYLDAMREAQRLEAARRREERRRRSEAAAAAAATTTTTTSERDAERERERRKKEQKQAKLEQQESLKRAKLNELIDNIMDDDDDDDDDDDE